MGQTLCVGAAIVFALPPDRAERFTGIIGTLCGSVVFYGIRKLGRFAYKKIQRRKRSRKYSNIHTCPHSNMGVILWTLKRLRLHVFMLFAL